MSTLWQIAYGEPFRNPRPAECKNKAADLIIRENKNPTNAKVTFIVGVLFALLALSCLLIAEVSPPFLTPADNWAQFKMGCDLLGASFTIVGAIGLVAGPILWAKAQKNYLDDISKPVSEIAPRLKKEIESLPKRRFKKLF